MTRIGSKQLALMALAMSTGCFYLGASSAAEPLALKASGMLAKREIVPSTNQDTKKSLTSLLAKSICSKVYW